MLTFLSKYWMPTSLTWWTGIAMLVSGVVMALASAIPALAAFAGPLSAVWGGRSDALLIAGGLAAIGFRSAVATTAAALADDTVKKASFDVLAADVAKVVAATSAPPGP